MTSYETILKTLLTDAVSKGLISEDVGLILNVMNEKDIENFYVMLLTVFSNGLLSNYARIDEVSNSLDIDLATGGELDRIGKWKGLPRLQATSSMVTVKLSFNAKVKKSFIITDKLFMKTKNGIQYSTVEPITVPVDCEYVLVDAYSVKKGNGYNINANTLTILETSISGYQCTINNPYASSGGSETQTDTEYREYLKKSDEAHQRGNKRLYYYYLDSVEGLESYHLIPKWDGTGTIKVVIDPYSSDFMNKIYNGLEEYCSIFDDALTVVGYIPISYNISMVCDVDIDVVNKYSLTEKEEIKNRIINCVDIYINGGTLDNVYYTGLKIGEDFIPYKLGVFLDNKVPELKNISFKSSEESVSISDEEKFIIDKEDIVVEVL